MDVYELLDWSRNQISNGMKIGLNVRAECWSDLRDINLFFSSCELLGVTGEDPVRKV